MASNKVLSFFSDIHGEYLILAELGVDMLEEGVWIVACGCKLLLRVTLGYLFQIKSLHHKVTIRSSRYQIYLWSHPGTLLRYHALVELEGSNCGGVVPQVSERLVVMLRIVD